MSGADIITIIRDPKHTLGKRFSVRGDGSLSKESNVMVAFGVAEQRQVPDAGAMAELLREVAEDPHAAIINAYFPAIPVGERFVVLSEKEMEKRLKLKTREQRVGVHSIGYEGSTLKAVCRLKDNVRPSSWQLFDRDVDHQTPAQFGAAMGFDAWLAAMGNLLPGVDSAPMVRAGSSSARVLMNGEPVGAGNGHLWVQIADADDAERLKVALQVRAAELGMAWRKLNKHGKAGALTTIIDTSVLIPGRLVFCGKPTATGKLEVLDQTVAVMGGKSPLNTSAVLLPSDDVVRDVTRRAGVEMTVRKGKGNSLAVDAYDLSYGTEIEGEGGDVLTVRDALDCLDDGKLRCQTPFRESESVAGVLRQGSDGRPCLFDVGDGTTHWLNNEEWVTGDFDDENAKVLAKINAQIDAYALAGDAHDELLVVVRTLIADIPAEQRAQAQVDALIERLKKAGCDLAATEQALQPVVQREAVITVEKPAFEEYDVDFTQLKPVEFAVDGFIANGLTVLAGAPGVGKTSMIAPLAAAVAGLYDSDIEAVLRRRVVYVSESPEQVERILYGLLRHAPGARPGAEFKEWFKVVAARRLPPERLAGLIRALVKRHTVLFNGYPVAPLIILDTSNATLDLDNENDNSEVGKAIAAIKENLSSGACWLVAHTPKAMQRADVEDLSARGAGAFAGDANATAFVFEEKSIPDKRFMLLRKHRFEAEFLEMEFSTETHQEVVATPWGTEQTIKYRIGLPAPSHPEKRTAAKESAKVARDEEHLTRRMREIRGLIRDYLDMTDSDRQGKSKNMIEKAVRRQAQDVRTCISHMVEDGDLVVAGTGQGGGALYALPPEPSLSVSDEEGAQ